MVRYGVREAVYAGCGTHDREPIYLTMAQCVSPSFAIRKMRD